MATFRKKLTHFFGVFWVFLKRCLLISENPSGLNKGFLPKTCKKLMTNVLISNSFKKFTKEKKLQIQDTFHKIKCIWNVSHDRQFTVIHCF